MNKIILIIIVVVVVIILIGVYFIYQVTKNSTYNTVVPGGTNNMSNINSSATSVSNAQNQTANLNSAVAIQNFSFSPATLNIKLGTTVTWTNNDSVPHQIKAATFNSAVLNNGDSFQFTFSSVGEYDYSCAIHTYMKGKIIVTN